MELNSQDKVAISLLKEVQTDIENYLGDQIAFPFDPKNYDSERDIFCEKMIKQCDLAEKKSTVEDVLFLSYVLKAQLYGCWQKPFGVRGTHPKAKEYYESAIKLAKNKEDEAEVRYRYALFARVGFGGGKDLAIENFNKVIEILGEDSKLGIECAKEIAKEQEKKKGCFIATAVYGSPYANEVIILKEFRDNWLLHFKLGKLFVSFYYWVSPPIANKITKSNSLKAITKATLVIPLIKIANYLKRKEK